MHGRRRVELLITVRAVVAPFVVTVALAGGPTGRPSVAPVLFPCGPGVLVRNAPARPDPIEAAFTQRSYIPGDQAKLTVVTEARRLAVQVFQVGPNQARPQNANMWTGRAVGPSRSTAVSDHQATLPIRIGGWPSGLYYARLSATGGRVGYAPFILTERLPEATGIAIVVPTNTWQAYNFRDMNGDGIGDTWYANPNTRVVDLDRPFLHNGVPSQERGGFFRWASRAHIKAVYLSDDDLDRLSTADLIRDFHLIVFAGHEEYVTARVFDALTSYRDHGGNLMFLSADNLNFRVTHTGHQIDCDGKFRSYGHQEASLVGVQYVDWNHNLYRSKPYTVTGARAAPWLFAGTGLRTGDQFGISYGVEIDARTAASPPGTIVLARIPDIFGPGRSAEMTYYQTKAGARVFAAGAMNFQTPQTHQAEQILTNVWQRLGRR
jgi:hypothetical protein